MKRSRKIGLLILILIVLIQVVQPTKNKSEGPSEDDISKVYAMPKDLHQTLVHKCYDCHSNNTRYPWYFNIQPIGWWLAAHVHDAKEHLNFSTFRNYTSARKANKLEDLLEVVEDGSMPIKSYVTFHPESVLTKEDQEAIKTWLATLDVRD